MTNKQNQPVPKSSPALDQLERDQATATDEERAAQRLAAQNALIDREEAGRFAEAKKAAGSSPSNAERDVAKNDAAERDAAEKEKAPKYAGVDLVAMERGFYDNRLIEFGESFKFTGNELPKWALPPNAAKAAMDRGRGRPVTSADTKRADAQKAVTTKASAGHAVTE